MTPTTLRQLLRLAEARKAGDLARLDGLMAMSRACEAEIAEAATTLTRDMAEGGADLPLAQQALRQAWVDQRIAQARRRLALLAIEITAARGAAVQSLGKHQALDKLATRAEHDAELVRIARKEREATAPEAPPD